MVLQSHSRLAALLAVGFGFGQAFAPE